MHCPYFDAGACRSCSLMGTAYAAQLAAKQARAEAVLASFTHGARWQEPVPSSESGFRNKAKLVIAGDRSDPTVGILDADGQGVDLRGCGLYEPGLHQSVLQVGDLVRDIGLVPYDVPSRTGELKHVLLTHSPDDELLVRFVLRSPSQVGRLRRHLELIQHRLPDARVVSANIQPEHKAVLEGDEEVILTEHETLPMVLGDVTLHLRPQSFFQTNTVVAEQLYAQAREWTATSDARSVWDLYCGVGGFGLHLVGPGRHVVGVESSPEAVVSARRSVSELRDRLGDNGVRAEFHAGDAAAFALDRPAPDLLVVNPPRRGIGGLAPWIESAGVPEVIYSSCNVDSLARDLAAMPSMRVMEARVFDMFPQTAHMEVIALLRRE